MAIRKNNLIVLKGRLEKEGLTFYQRGGTTVIRQATSKQPHRRTRGQFEARQRMANCTSLWKALRLATEPVLAGGKSSYGRFCTLMRKLPVTYLTKDERKRGAKLLLPGMPVSDGMLPDIEYWLGEVEGLPALLTSLRLKEGARSMASSLYGRGAELKRDERLCLYRLVQTAKVEKRKTNPASERQCGGVGLRRLPERTAVRRHRVARCRRTAGTGGRRAGRRYEGLGTGAYVRRQGIEPKGGDSLQPI